MRLLWCFFVLFAALWPWYSPDILLNISCVFTKESKSCRSEMTWGWVNDQQTGQTLSFLSVSLFEARWFFRMNVNIKMLYYCAAHHPADMTHTGRHSADRQATEALGLRRDSEVFLLLLGRGDREKERDRQNWSQCNELWNSAVHTL